MEPPNIVGDKRANAPHLIGLLRPRGKRPNRRAEPGNEEAL
jgi:hypothetical protein